MTGEEIQHILQIVGLIVLPLRQFSFIQLVIPRESASASPLYVTTFSLATPCVFSKYLA